MKVKKNYNVDEAIDFLFDGNQSHLSGLSSDKEENNDTEDAVQNNFSDDERTDTAESDDDTSLASLAEASNQISSNDQGHANYEPAQRVYRWRKREIRYHSFLKKLSEPPLEDMTPLQYFSKFISTAFLDIDIVFKLFINPSIQTVQK